MKPKHIFIILLLLGCQTLIAQPIPDELKALVSQANSNFPRLKEQERQVKAGEVRVDINRSALRPNVTADASYRYINPVPKPIIPLNGRDVALQFQPNHNVASQVGVSQTIYDFGRTEADIRRAQDDVQLLRRSLELTRHNLDYQVASAYYGIGFLQKSIAVQDSVIRVAEENIQVIINRLRNGDALEFDILTQRVRLETAKNRKIDLENNLEKQKSLLSYLTGTAAPAINASGISFDIPVAGSPTGGSTQVPFNLEGALQVAQTGNKELQVSNEQVRAAQTDVLISQKAGLPNITFSGAAGFKNGYLPEINQLKFNVAAGVGISAPIYAGKRNKLLHQSAVLNAEASRFAHEQASAGLRQSLEQLSADIRSNQQKLQNIDTQVLQARKALDIAQTRLRNGVITNVELQSAETGVEEAELARLNFQYQLRINQLEYKRLLGENLY